MTTTQPREEATVPVARPTWRHGPLPEIIGYVGAALVASAGLNLVSQSWDSWPVPWRFALSAAGTVVLYITAITITVTVGGRALLTQHVTRRRLVGVITSLAAPLVGASVALTFDWLGVDYGTVASPLPLVFVGAAVLAACVSAWWAPGVVPTLAVAGASFVWFQVLIGNVIAPWEQPLAIAVVSAIATLAWLVIAPRLLPPRILTQALGIAAFIVMQVSEAFMAFDMPPLLDETAEQRLTWAMWFARVALLGFAVASLYLFARGGAWVWAVGGVVAAGAGALSIAGQALGWIAGLFAAGMILLAASGVLLLARTRQRSDSPTSDPAP
jgi:hypothetical protein